MNDSPEQNKILKHIRSNTTIIGLILIALLLTQIASCVMQMPATR